jgi:TolA-binding protein
MSDEQSQEPAVVSELEASEEARPGKKVKATKKKAVEPQSEETQAEAPVITLAATSTQPAAEAALSVSATDATDSPPSDRNDDLFQQGVQSLLRGEYDAADNFFGQALMIYRKNGDQPGQIAVLEQLGHLCYLRGAEVQAREYYQQAGLMRAV